MYEKNVFLKYRHYKHMAHILRHSSLIFFTPRSSRHCDTSPGWCSSPESLGLAAARSRQMYRLLETVYGWPRPRCWELGDI